MITWKIKGKFEGQDINKLPDDYLAWYATNGKNAEAVKLANAAIAYRAKQEGTTATQSTDTAATQQSTQINEFQALSIRARMLELAIQINPKMPWSALPQVRGYVVEGKLPQLSELLDEQSPWDKPESIAGPEDFESELADAGAQTTLPMGAPKDVPKL
jgi:uncharacterized protein (DUF3820 family)